MAWVIGTQEKRTTWLLFIGKIDRWCGGVTTDEFLSTWLEMILAV
jgi:hypothetical protein